MTAGVGEAAEYLLNQMKRSYQSYARIIAVDCTFCVVMTGNELRGVSGCWCGSLAPARRRRSQGRTAAPRC